MVALKDKQELIFVTQQLLARLLGVEDRTVRNWVSKKYFEVGKNGQINLDSALAWRLAELENKPSQKGLQSAKLKLIQSQARKSEAEAKLKELDYEERKGNLLDRDWVEKTQDTRSKIVSQRLLTTASTLSPQLAALTDAREISLLLKQEFSIILQELATNENPPHPDRLD